MASGERLADIQTTEHLTNFAQSFGNGLGKEVDLLAPIILTQGEKFEYGEWSKASGYEAPGMDLRAPGSLAKEFITEYSIKSDSCDAYGGRIKVPQRQINEYAGPLSLLEVKTQQMTVKAFDSRRARMASLIASTACSYTAAASAKWDHATTTAIFYDINLGINSVLDQSGKMPNVLAIPRKVARAMKRSAEFVARYQYFADTVRSAALPDVVEDMKVVVLPDMYNTAKRNKTASLSSIWGETVWIMYVEPNPDPYSLTALSTFRPVDSPDIKIESYWDEAIKSFWVEYNLTEKVKLINQECIYAISDCLT